jgi:hypothetical protein
VILKKKHFVTLKVDKRSFRLFFS